MHIALDVMGGDYAPQEIVAGGCQAAEAYPEVTVVLVGREEEIRVAGSDVMPKNVIIEPAGEIITMDEHPADAVRRKKDASIVVATRMVKEGKAAAVVSAGSTGAQMAAALLGLGRIKGIKRPGIATVLPTLTGGKLMLDVGANVDADPEHLLQYGIMGSIYAEQVLGIPAPKVALLNIGGEEGKGNELVKAAYELLKESSLHFTGNVEGRELLKGGVDVIVCEAFTGNVALKTIEGTASVIMQLLKEQLTAGFTRKLGAALVKPGLMVLKSFADYSEFGGAPLLGVNGTSIVCHGSSQAKAIKNGIRVAKECVEAKVTDKIKEQVSQVKEMTEGVGD